MSFSLAAIRSVANNRSLGTKKRKSIQTTGLPIAKVTGEILEPASALVVKQFQDKLAKERKYDQMITAAVLTMSLLVSGSLLLLMLGKI